MSLSEGNIVGTDLSPNANILGNQIADKTLSLRNLSDDAFKIMSTNTKTVTIPGFTLNTGGAVYGTSQQSTVVTHNLGFVPAVMIFNSNGSGYSPSPDLNLTNVGAATWGLQWITATATPTTITFFSNALGLNQNVAIPAKNIKYYLMQESASAT